METSYQNVYQIKISLQGIIPEIWRRIQVSETFSFWDLHVAIQDAMGWRNYHFHQFRIKKPGRKKYLKIGDSPDDNELSGRNILLSNYLTTENDKIEYLYDFVDGWKHLLVLEKVLPKEPQKQYPICLAGEMACPPEECGGAKVYGLDMDVLKNPKHPDYKILKKWMGDDFDPTYFNPQAVRFADPELRWEDAQGIPF